MVVIFRVVVVVVMAMVAVVMGFEVVHVLLVVGMGEQRGPTHLLNVGNFRPNFVASPGNKSIIKNSDIA